jgi:hypothetical protein
MGWNCRHKKHGRQALGKANICVGIGNFQQAGASGGYYDQGMATKALFNKTTRVAKRRPKKTTRDAVRIHADGTMAFFVGGTREDCLRCKERDTCAFVELGPD